MSQKNHSAVQFILFLLRALHLMKFRLSTKKSSLRFPGFVLLFFVIASLPLPYQHLSQKAWAISPDEIKKKEEDIRAYMFTISRQLGITCTTCHETENFRIDKKVEYKTALEHMKITQTLIDKGFDGKRGPKADCYMCHRGTLKPAFKEPQNPMRE